MLLDFNVSTYKEIFRCVYYQKNLKLLIRSITFKANNPKDLSKKIIQLLSIGKKFDELKNYGLDFVKKYDWQDIARVYFEYTKLLQ